MTVATGSTPNYLAPYIPKILAMALKTLRANAKTTMLVNRQYDKEAGDIGSTITVPRPSPQLVRDVEPSANQPEVEIFETSQVVIPMDQWKITSFVMTDKEFNLVDKGIIPGQLEAGMAALADTMDKYVLGLYKGVSNVFGVPGTVPFFNDPQTATERLVRDTRPITECGRILNEELAPLQNRRMVLNPTAEAAAKNIRALQDVSWGQTPEVIRMGNLPTTLGFTFWMNQNVIRHISGNNAGQSAADKRRTTLAIPITSGSGDTLKTLKVTTISIASGAEGDFVPGDVVSFTGHASTYAVKEASATTLVLHKPLEAALEAAAVITSTPDHDVNLAFHQDAIVFVNRPLSRGEMTPGQTAIKTIVDTQISNLALRLEVVRQNKRTMWELDSLFGGTLLRPEHVVRLIS